MGCFCGRNAVRNQPKENQQQGEGSGKDHTTLLSAGCVPHIKTLRSKTQIPDAFGVNASEESTTNPNGLAYFLSPDGLTKTVADWYRKKKQAVVRKPILHR